MMEGFVKNNINPFSIVYRFVDLLIIQLTLMITLAVYNAPLTERYIIISLVASTSYFLASEALRLYRSWRTSSIRKILFCTFMCWCCAIVIISLFLYAYPNLSLYIISLWCVISLFSLMGWRIAYRYILFYFRNKGYNTRTVAIIGATKAGIKVAKQISESPETGFRLRAFYDDRDSSRIDETYKDYIGGNVEKGVEKAKKGHFDTIYIALPIGDHERITDILKRLGNTTSEVHFVPDFFMFNLINSRLSYIGSLQTISVYETPLKGPSNFLKRLEDIILSCIILCLISPLLLLIGILIKLDSPGPIIFKQIRYGISGQKIKVYKFRSMRVLDNGEVVKQATKGDSRITKLGAFLRKSSLDELPQFINVLQGSMSIVGPRPHAVAHNEEYRDKVNYYMLRHLIKPGITGWAQVNGWRGETDTLEKMEKRIEFDLEYMRNWSVFLDIEIIFLTFFKGFFNKNAY